MTDAGPEPRSSLRYGVACCQTDFPCPRDRSEITSRVDRMIAMLEGAVAGYEPFFPIRLIVFPEFAHAAPVYLESRQLRERLAVELPNEHTERYRRRAAALGVFIQTGSFLERDPAWPGVVFNTTCLIGPSGVLSKYRKVNPWIPWEVAASPHDLEGYQEDPFPVVETEIGRIGAAICYDWIFPETIRELVFRGAELLLRVSAYMDPWGATEPMDWWTVVNRCRAIENLAYVVAANQGASLAHYGPFSWPGSSMLVDYDGRLLAQADPGAGEKVVVAEVDIGALREARAQRLGHNPLAHLRAEIHSRGLDGPRGLGASSGRHYPPSSFTGVRDPEGNRTVADNQEAIRRVLSREPWRDPGPETDG